MAIAAPISGALSDRIGSRLPGMIGMGILAVGLFLLSRLGPDTQLWLIVAAMAVAGAGTGIFISPNTSALMGSAPRARQGIASGVQAAARNFGMVLGIGLAAAIFTTHLAKGGTESFYAGIGQAFLVASGIALLGVLVSAVKND